MNKILIVGGAGYVGGYLTDLLQENGYDVTVFDNLLYETRFLKKVKFIRGDVRNKDLLEKIASNYDCIVWLAAIVGDGACEVNKKETKEVNEDSLKWLVDSNLAKKIIFTSTCSVYGACNELISESSAANPLSVYAKTKLAAEKYLISNHSNCLVFRLGTLHGLGDLFSRIRLDLVANVLTYKATVGEKLTVFGGEQWRPLLHVRDVATAILHSFKNNTTGLYNLSENNYKIHEIADEIQSIIGKVEVEKTSKSFEDLRNYRVSNNKILTTGWSPTYTLSCGIKDMKNLIEENRITDISNPVYSNEAYLLTKSGEIYEDRFN
ncbi:NAD-dependent dehydratase [archaeon]|nr:NAD-dependent dehydratase [archaeon]